MQAAPAAARPGAVSGTNAFDLGVQPSLSADGRFVAYAGGPPSAFGSGAQVYIRDRQLRTRTLVSTAAAGGEPDGPSLNPSVSASGRYVAYASDADDIAPGDLNAATDIFVRDRVTGTTTLASVATGGAGADGSSELPSISADGRDVAFVSRARNLAGPDTNDNRDVFIRDLDAGTTTRVSIGLGGAEPDGESYTAAISADGGTVVFASNASNLVSGDTNNEIDVFAFDRATGTIRRVSVTPAGEQANGGTVGVSRTATNANGSVFAFGTFASNLLGRSQRGADVVARDEAAGTVERISSGGQFDNPYEEVDSPGPALSGDGRLVAFASAGAELPRYLDSSTMDVYVRDRANGAITRVTQLSQCRPAGGINGFPAVSADGRWVAFQSDAIDLLQRGAYQGGTPSMHVYVASTRAPTGTEICALAVRPRTIRPSTGGNIRITLSKRGSFRIRIYRVRHHKLHRRATIRGRGFDAGPHLIAFNGRIRGHTLGPGTFVAVANGSARGAPSKRARFKIRRP